MTVKNVHKICGSSLQIGSMYKLLKQVCTSTDRKNTREQNENLV